MQIHRSTAIAAEADSTHFRRMVIESPRVRAGVLGFDTGEVVRPHLHPGSDEIFLFLRGEVEFRGGDDPPARVGPGDVVCLAAGELHAFTVTAGPVVVLAVVAPNRPDDFYPDER